MKLVKTKQFITLGKQVSYQEREKLRAYRESMRDMFTSDVCTYPSIIVYEDTDAYYVLKTREMLKGEWEKQEIPDAVDLYGLDFQVYTQVEAKTVTDIEKLTGAYVLIVQDK